MRTERYVWKEPVRPRYCDSDFLPIDNVEYIEMDAIKISEPMISISELTRAVAMVKKNFVKKLLNKAGNTSCTSEMIGYMGNELREVEITLRELREGK